MNRMTVQLIGADIWHSIQLLSDNNITLYEIQVIDELSMLIVLSFSDFKRAEKILRIRGDLLQIKQTAKAITVLRFLQRRAIFLLAVFFVCILSILIPRWILFIDVKGNENIPTNRIVEQVELCGIRFGTLREEIRSENIKNMLLDAIPDFEWAGVNSIGPKAIISVQEKTGNEMRKDFVHSVSNIVSSSDGIIQSVSVTNGTAVCAEGQAVVKGQQLISGMIDCDFCIRVCRARGEIFAQTVHKINAYFPNDFFTKSNKTAARHGVSLLVGKKRINLWKDSGIWDASCDRIYLERYLTLPGGRKLPLAICIETYSGCELTHQRTSKAEIEVSLKKLCSEYLTEQMIAGRIMNGEESIESLSGATIMHGEYQCLEMIGREQFQKIGDQNGETN